MECGISLFAGNGWLALLTWIAFAIVITFVVTAAVARRDAARGASPVLPSAELRRLESQIDEIARRLDALERGNRGA